MAGLTNEHKWAARSHGALLSQVWSHRSEPSVGQARPPGRCPPCRLHSQGARGPWRISRLFASPSPFCLHRPCCEDASLDSGPSLTSTRPTCGDPVSKSGRIPRACGRTQPPPPHSHGLLRPGRPGHRPLHPQARPLGLQAPSCPQLPGTPPSLSAVASRLRSPARGHLA